MPEATLEIVATETAALAEARPAAVASQPADHWGAARRYLEASRMFARADLAAQVMAGFEMLTLHAAYEVQAGRKKANSFTRERIYNSADQRLWKDAVQEELGVSEATAWRWMQMARAVKPRLKKEGIDLPSLRLLEINPLQLAAGQREQLMKAVHKITDGKSQMEFMLEEGLVKKPQGSGAVGGAKVSKKPPTIEEAATLMARLAQDKTEYFANLVEEALLDRPFNAADEPLRRRLHGLLIDLAAAVKESLR